MIGQNILDIHVSYSYVFAFLDLGFPVCSLCFITLLAVWRNNSMYYSNVTIMVNIESSIKVIFQNQFMVASI